MPSHSFTALRTVEAPAQAPVVAAPRVPSGDKPQRGRSALLTLLIVVAAVVAGLLMWWVRFSPIAVSIAPVEANVREQVFGLGTVGARVQSNIGFKVAGVLVALKADQGDRVQSGQLLAQLDALALASRGLAIAVERRDRVDLALQLGDLQLHTGRGLDALEAYRSALNSGGSEQDRRRALIGCAAANRLLARIDDAFAALGEAEPLAVMSADDRALAEIHYLRGNLHFARGELEACRDAHSSALRFAERLDAPEWRARALSGLADAEYMDCRMSTALRHFSECVDICDANGLTRIAVPNRVIMGACHLYVCDFDVALDDMRKALESARRIGDLHAERFALSNIGGCLTAAARYDAIGDTLAMALEQARALKARRYEAWILALCAELALIEGRREEALSLVRQGLAASDETSPRFVGPILFGLLALLEPGREAQEAAISAGESLLAKGAFGHNHFWFRRHAIEQALLTGQWDAVDRHADALLARMSGEPLPYSSIVARRGQLLARQGAGTATSENESELDRLRAKAAEVDFRIDALGDALRRP